MASLPIAVWERNPYWVPELQRQLEGTGTRVTSCRIEVDVLQRLAEGASQLVIALPMGERIPLPAVQRWIAEGLRIHVILNPADEPYRWFLHELGVASVFDFEGARAHLIAACRTASDECVI